MRIFRHLPAFALRRTSSLSLSVKRKSSGSGICRDRGRFGLPDRGPELSWTKWDHGEVPGIQLGYSLYRRAHTRAHTPSRSLCSRSRWRRTFASAGHGRPAFLLRRPKGSHSRYSFHVNNVITSTHEQTQLFPYTHTSMRYVVAPLPPP